MSAENIWFPMYVNDYLGDTMHLECVEHGAYLLLLFAYYKNQGPLVDDDKRFAAITRLSLSDWRAIRSAIQKLFIVLDGMWHHKRADFEIIRRKAAQEARKQGAKRTNEARWGKSVTDTVTESLSDLRASRSSVGISQSQSQSESYSKTESEKNTLSGKPDDMRVLTEARVVIHFLNEQTGAKFRESDSSFKFIVPRLKERDVTLDGIKQMITRQTRIWKGTDMAQYLRPSTLFNETKFNGYYAARELPVPVNGKNHNSVTPDHSKGF